MDITEGSRQRFRILFERYHAEVYAYFRRRTDAQSAADGVSETYLVAWRRLGDVPEGDAALPWLYGVARRVLANQFRGARRRRGLLTRLRGADPNPNLNPGPETMVVRRERDQTVLAALDRLRPQDQEVLRLAWWEGLCRADIAALLGCSTGAVTQRIHRAAQRAAREYRRLDHSRVGSEARPQMRGGESS